MSTRVASENWSSLVINDGCEFSEEIQVLSENNCAFLVSFMDELYDDDVNEGDEERLNSVIQSLEAEINHSTGGTNVVANFDVGCLGTDGQDCFISFDDLEMDGGWIDHTEAVVVPDYCSTGDNFNSYMIPREDDNIPTNYDYASQILWQDLSYMIQ